MFRWKLFNWGFLKFYDLISDVVNVVDDEWDGGIGSLRLYNWLFILNLFILFFGFFLESWFVYYLLFNVYKYLKYSDK